MDALHASSWPAALGLASAIILVLSLLASFLLRRERGGKGGAPACSAENGHLASNGAAAAPEEEDSRSRCTILFGTQTGTAERFAKSLRAQLESKYGVHTSFDVVDIENYDAPARLPREALVLLLMATYGDGEPTDSATDFYEWLGGEHAGADEPLTGVSFAVFGLGNRQYEHFCAMGARVHKLMEGLGGAPVLPHGEGDDDADIDADFDSWSAQLFDALDASALVRVNTKASFVGGGLVAGRRGAGLGGGWAASTWSSLARGWGHRLRRQPPLQCTTAGCSTCQARPTAATRSGPHPPIHLQAENRRSLNLGGGDVDAYGVELLGSTVRNGALDTLPAGGTGLAHGSPLLATVSAARELHALGSGRSCVHVELDVGGSRLAYEAGDHVGIFAENSPEVVEAAAAALGVPPDTAFRLTASGQHGQHQLPPPFEGAPPPSPQPQPVAQQLRSSSSSAGSRRAPAYWHRAPRSSRALTALSPPIRRSSLQARSRCAARSRATPTCCRRPARPRCRRWQPLPLTLSRRRAYGSWPASRGVMPTMLTSSLPSAACWRCCRTSRRHDPRWVRCAAAAMRRDVLGWAGLQRVRGLRCDALHANLGIFPCCRVAGWAGQAAA